MGGATAIHPEHVSHSHPHGGVTVLHRGAALGGTSGSHAVGGAASSGGGGVVDSHQHESVMQQLLSNISAAAGTNEVLGFGVSSATGTQRNRGM